MKSKYDFTILTLCVVTSKYAGSQSCISSQCRQCQMSLFDNVINLKLKQSTTLTYCHLFVKEIEFFQTKFKQKYFIKQKRSLPTKACKIFLFGFCDYDLSLLISSQRSTVYILSVEKSNAYNIKSVYFKKRFAKILEKSFFIIFCGPLFSVATSAEFLKMKMNRSSSSAITFYFYF